MSARSTRTCSTASDGAAAGRWPRLLLPLELGWPAGSTLAAASLLALVCLVVNRMPCLEVETFDDGLWPSPRWTAAGGVGGAVERRAAHDGSHGLSDVPWHYRVDLVLRPGSRLSAWVRADRPGAGRFYLGFDAGPDGCKSLVLAFNTNDLRFHENPDWGFTELAATTVSLESDRWYLLEVELEHDGTNALGRLYAADGTTLLATVRQAYAGGVGAGGVALRTFGGVSVDSLALCP